MTGGSIEKYLEGRRELGQVFLVALPVNDR
jgi:hypothetical protein